MELYFGNRKEKKSEREFRIELGNSVLNLETLSKQHCGQWPVAELDCSVLFLCMNLTMGKLLGIISQFRKFLLWLLHSEVLKT